jgi:AraC family transcriptional regulator
MPVPDKTSAEAIDHYAVGTRILASKGTAWDGVRVSVFALPPVAKAFTMPAVNEPFIAVYYARILSFEQERNR